MTIQTISIEIPSDLLVSLNETEQELKVRIKIALAVQLYTEEKLTIGKAAQIAGYSRLDFETMLSQQNIPISNLDLSDVLGDVEKLN
jgi:predicted HTH domain antitoxin